MVVAPMAPMVSMAWMDLMTPELKSDREKVHWFGAHLLHPHSPYQAFCFAFLHMPSWYSAINELASRCHTEGEGQIQKSQMGEKLMECELMDAVKLVVKELKGCLVKLVKNELMDCLTKLL